MDPRPLIAGVLGVAAFTLQLYASSGHKYRSTRFGLLPGTFLNLTGLVDTNALQQIHWDLNTWSDEEVLRWRDSQLASANAIAVAGAIFASVGLTALQLPGMYEVHWTARCLLAASMILGTLSVTKAAGLHQQIGILNSPLAIRLWLSRGRHEAYSEFIFSAFIPRYVTKPARKSTLGNSTHEDPPSEPKASIISEFDVLPLESSISALKVIAMPRALLDIALLFFIVGFLLYILLTWVENVESRPSDSRNIFIVLLIVTLVYILCDFALKVARAFDQAKRKHEFGNTRLGGFDQSDRIAELEAELRAARGVMQPDIDSAQPSRLGETRSFVSTTSAQPSSRSGSRGRIYVPPVVH